ncbi:MAG: hypothetical protein SFV55_00780 [Haliscomenobacter sp.]|uniref:hypothetical protein n=1 Tax=Haliscomenobacter sp. TaxID=2717303 RepID=UPI0029A93238|nr:hypothetical protein [Haliscomenobacter sp.]MDX2066921.1 hypothetical protein [Haliscomenobacter sp.]
MKIDLSSYFFWTLITLFSFVIIQLVLLKGWDVKPLFDEKILNWSFRVLLLLKISYLINALIVQRKLKKNGRKA